jgi:hypothetical protein
MLKSECTKDNSTIDSVQERSDGVLLVSYTLGNTKYIDVEFMPQSVDGNKTDLKMVYLPQVTLTIISDLVADISKSMIKKN